LKEKSEGAVLKMLRNEEGLTLLELMISMFLIGTILLIVSGAMRLGYRSVSTGENKINSLERFRSSLTIINAQIQSWTPIAYEQSGEKGFYFEGASGFLKMTTNYSIWGGQKGYVIVEYRVKTDADNMQSLVASESPVGIEKKNETQLLQGFNAIYFEYFLKNTNEEEGAWVGRLDDNSQIPQKIRLHLVQGKRIFSIIFPLRAQMSLAGAYSDQPLLKGFTTYGNAA
jgi:type II secretory pathway component PulJ